MNRSLVLTLAAVGLFALGVLAANTRIAQSVIPVGPYEADINKDARVNSIDQLWLAKNYGLPVPTATVAPQPIGGRAILHQGDELLLIDSLNGTTIRDLSAPPTRSLVATSCDGRYVAFTRSSGGPLYDAEVILADTGATVATTPPTDNLGISAIFPCPLGRGAAAPADARAVILANTPQGVGQIYIYDLSSSSQLYSGPAPYRFADFALGLTCDGSTVLHSASASEVRVVRLADGVVVATLPNGESKQDNEGQAQQMCG